MCKFLSTGSEINSNFTKFKAKDTQELIFCWRPPHPHADICTKTVWTRHNFVYLIILFLSTKQYENSNMSWGYPCRKHKHFNTFISIAQCFKIFLTLEVSWWNKCTCLQARVDSFRSKPAEGQCRAVVINGCNDSVLDNFVIIWLWLVQGVGGSIPPHHHFTL